MAVVDLPFRRIPLQVGGSNKSEHSFALTNPISCLTIFLFAVPGGHPQGHAQPEHQLQQQRAGGGREDGDGRGEPDGGHRAVLGGVVGGDEKVVFFFILTIFDHEKVVGGFGGSRMLLPVQRISAERLCKIVSSCSSYSCSLD